MQLIGIVLFLLLFLSLFVWISGSFTKLVDCSNQNSGNSDCLTGLVISSPPIQEAQDLQNTCEKSNTACLAKLGQKAIENKAEESIH